MTSHCNPCTDELEQLLLREPALAAAWQALPRHTLAPRTTLLRAGENVQCAWRIESGLVRSYFLSPDGRERNHAFHAEQQWIGAGTPPAETASPYAIETLEETRVVELPYGLLREWQQRSLQVRSLLDAAFERIFVRQTQRESELLLLSAPERYQAFVDANPKLAARLPLHHVASYLGITNVALSRIRGRKTRG